VPSKKLSTAAFRGLQSIHRINPPRPAAQSASSRRAWLQDGNRPRLGQCRCTGHVPHRRRTWPRSWLCALSAGRFAKYSPKRSDHSKSDRPRRSVSICVDTFHSAAFPTLARSFACLFACLFVRATACVLAGFERLAVHNAAAASGESIIAHRVAGILARDANILTQNGPLSLVDRCERWRGSGKSRMVNDAQ
jgi:hypothetical protein